MTEFFTEEPYRLLAACDGRTDAAWEEPMTMLDAFERCGIRDPGITGGEPMVRKDFRDLPDEIAKRDFRCGEDASSALFPDKAKRMWCRLCAGTWLQRVSFRPENQKGGKNEIALCGKIQRPSGGSASSRS